MAQMQFVFGREFKKIQIENDKFELFSVFFQIQTAFVAHFQSVFVIQNVFVENAFVNDDFPRLFLLLLWFYN